MATKKSSTPRQAKSSRPKAGRTRATIKPSAPNLGPKRGARGSAAPLVAILTGSPNDLGVVSKAKEVLDQLGIPSELKVLSAHRTPERVQQYIEKAEAAGAQVFIACAGMAAHLAGVVAAHTIKPVIGVPLASGALNGFDALLSTVQMPPGIPVATVGVDGSKNAAYLAARILTATHPEIAARLQADLDSQRERYDTV